jgi:hypothetical protein
MKTQNKQIEIERLEAEQVEQRVAPVALFPLASTYSK